MHTDDVKTSKFLSLVLRHRPEKIGLVLDANGWAEVDDLLVRMKIDRETLERVVATNDKQRFAFDDTGSRIRANQGHSLQDVDLQLRKQRPPEVLFHGTAAQSVENIRQSGLHSGRRQHVHLSLNEETALQVGKRHGRAVILKVRAGDMYRNGHAFYLSENGVWLCEAVPPAYLEFS